MKYRDDFVSNSSSTSFICIVHNDSEKLITLEEWVNKNYKKIFERLLWTKHESIEKKAHEEIRNFISNYGKERVRPRYTEVVCIVVGDVMKVFLPGMEDHWRPAFPHDNVHTSVSCGLEGGLS